MILHPDENPFDIETEEGIAWYWIIDAYFADSIYTERFMGLPSDNLHGYEQGQLLNKVDNIKTKMYYLIHGTLDDNVHYQQSLLLAKVLEQKDILFRQQVRSSVRFTSK